MNLSYTREDSIHIPIHGKLNNSTKCIHQSRGEAKWAWGISSNNVPSSVGTIAILYIQTHINPVIPCTPEITISIHKMELIKGTMKFEANSNEKRGKTLILIYVD